MDLDDYTIPQLLGLREALSVRLHRIDNGTEEANHAEESRLRRQLGILNNEIDQAIAAKAKSARGKVS